MGRSSKAIVLSLVGDVEPGTIRLEDGRELPFGLAAYDPTDAPEKGDAVRVTVRPSHEGDKVVKLGRVRAPRPSLDEALTPGILVPVGRDDLRRPLRHEPLGTLSFHGGVGFADIAGGDAVRSIADAGDVTGEVVAIYQEGVLAFVRIDFVPFAPGRTWSRRLGFESRSGSFALVPMSGRVGLAMPSLEGVQACLEKTFVALRGTAATVRVASDASDKPTTVVVELRVCETK